MLNLFSKIKRKIEHWAHQWSLKDKKVHLHKYLTRDNLFDYETYRKIQIAGNKRKIKESWVSEESVVFIAGYLKKKLPHISLGICHGTRRGLEQQWFSKYLGAKVIGTEISDTAISFPNTIEWDFHEENPEWVEVVDFVYSNSLDHAYDPKKALTVWMRSLKPGGICMIEHTNAHEVKHSNALDPFGASLEIMPYLILDWGEGKYSVREILHQPSEEKITRHYFVVQNN